MSTRTFTSQHLSKHPDAEQDLIWRDIDNRGPGAEPFVPVTRINSAHIAGFL